MRTLIALTALATLAGCAAHTPNPIDYVVYHDEPLVRQVEDGMTREQVQTLGGPPSSSVQRVAHPGTCNNYVLEHDGAEQVYHVAFDAAGRVDDKGFMTCKQMEDNQRAH